MTNEVPTIHSEGHGVERVNELLDKLTSKRFVTSELAVRTIRAALDLTGITLPHLEVEGTTGSTTMDGHAAQLGVTSKTDPDMTAPPTEGEWFFKIKDSDGPDGDFDDDLYLYIVLNRDEEGYIECYAQILLEDELDEVGNMDNISVKDYTDLVGDVSGEDTWLKSQRHIGVTHLDGVEEE